MKFHCYHPVVTTWRVLFRGLSVMVAISRIPATVETRHALSTQQRCGKPPPCRFFTSGDEISPVSPLRSILHPVYPVAITKKDVHAVVFSDQ